MTVRTTSWVQVAEKNFLCRAAGLSLREKVRRAHRAGAWSRDAAPSKGVKEGVPSD